MFSNRVTVFTETNELHPTFAINLKHRPDRREHIIRELTGYDCFRVEIVDASEDVVGAIGLWKSIVKIVRKAVLASHEYIIICEDDHIFTPSFKPLILAKCINEGRIISADVIIGGASAVYSCCKVSENLIWMESFTGTQFVVVFSKFFDKILNAEFDQTDSADFKLASLTRSIYCTYPFFSVQKEFGYSDVTTTNSTQGRLLKLFSEASDAVQFCLERFNFFQKIYREKRDDVELDEISLCTFIFKSCDSGGGDVGNAISNMQEFNVVGSVVTDHEIGDIRAIGFLKEAVTAAISADEDLLVVVASEHVFTESYSKELLINAILDANDFGADVLLGGVNGGFTHALPATGNCFWINDFLSANFIVLFRKFFYKVLSARTENISDKSFLPTLTSNAFLVFPFLSKNRTDAFGILPDLGMIPGSISTFEFTEKRILYISDGFDDARHNCRRGLDV